MKFVLIILVISLITRNAFYFGIYSEIFRGIALVLCFCTSIFWISLNTSLKILVRYWPVFGYIGVFLLSTIGTANFEYVLFQDISLTTVFLFSIAFYESQSIKKDAVNSMLFKTTMILYSIVCIISLILALVGSSSVYEVLYGGEVRFKGVFAKSSMIGSSAGLLVGISWFSISNKWLKIIAIVAGGICVALTLSRTFWIAIFLSLFITTWLYQSRSRKWIGIGFILSVLLVMVVYVFQITINTKEAAKITRIDSATNLSGRTSLWESGLQALEKKPFLGYGLTSGSISLEQQHKLNSPGINSSRERGRRTFHNGYLQSLLDVGILGSFFYLVIILKSIFNIYKYDTLKLYSAEFFAILFLTISNIAENSIYAVSVFNSVLFWILAVFSMYLKSVVSGNERNAN